LDRPPSTSARGYLSTTAQGVQDVQGVHVIRYWDHVAALDILGENLTRPPYPSIALRWAAKISSRPVLASTSIISSVAGVKGFCSAVP
jgi:hypothetical protein